MAPKNWLSADLNGKFSATTDRSSPISRQYTLDTNGREESFGTHFAVTLQMKFAVGLESFPPSSLPDYVWCTVSTDASMENYDGDGDGDDDMRTTAGWYGLS